MVDLTPDRRRELGGFLRSRRERLSPDAVGLPAGGRRRTPGLRREEVAALSGVGVTWYTWLEQARNVNASPQVLDAIARALRLDRRERAHLFTLASALDAAALDDDGVVLSQGFGDLISQLDPFPAAAFSWRYDFLRYNTGYRFLIADLDTIPDEDRNYLWLFFTDARWITGCDEWEAAAASLVSKFRARMVHHMGDPLGQELLERLCAESHAFARLWSTRDVTSPPREVKAFRSPVGRLLLRPHRLVHGEAEAWILAYTPADAETAQRLPRLLDLVGEAERAGQSVAAGSRRSDHSLTT